MNIITCSQGASRINTTDDGCILQWQENSNAMHRPTMSTAFIIFGASGDLTARKLIPALYNNYRKKRFQEGVQIIGFSRTQYSDDAFRKKMKEAITSFAANQFDNDVWKDFAQSLHYQPGDIHNTDHYHALTQRINN